MSPTLPGTVPTTVLPPGLNGEFNPMQTAVPTQPTILPQTHGMIPTSGAVVPPASYLPPFHFAHPEFLSKNPFLPYDLANLRAVTNGRTMHHIQHNFNAAAVVAASNGHTTLQSISSDNLNTSRLSPASSRPSSSSPPSSGHSISIKMNATIDIQSMQENSSEDSDDEQIDVVKSAFVPILRPNPTNQSIVGIADSTVHEPTITEAQNRQRCELKAPSSRKPLHETAVGPRSPETKIKSPISATKTVWRPY